ncbi:MAG: hypothetical protein R3F43_05055 [bacterium]
MGRHHLQGGARTCEAEVTGLALMAWLGSRPTRAGAPRPARPGRARAMTIASGGHREAAPGSTCKGARRAEAGPSALHVARQPVGVDAAAAIERFWAHPAYQALQKRFMAPRRRAGAGRGRGVVLVRQLPAGEDTYVYAGAQVGGCGALRRLLGDLEGDGRHWDVGNRR